MIVTIQFSIFAIISCVYAPRFPTMDAGKGFVRRLLITFLTGFAFGTGVNLCIFPMTSRMVISKQIAGMCGLLKASIMAQGAYMQAVGEAKDPSEEKAKAGALKATRTALGGLFSSKKVCFWEALTLTTNRNKTRRTLCEKRTWVRKDGCRRIF